MPPETEALPGDGRRILFAELAFDPARKDYGPYGQVRILGHAAPPQRDQRCGPQLHGLRHDDQIAAIGTEDIFGETAASRSRHDQHHDPHDELAREEQKLIADREKGHDQRVGHQIARAP